MTDQSSGAVSDDLKPEELARAQARAREMLMILAEWGDVERTLQSPRLGIRIRLRAGQRLEELNKAADRIVNEVMAP